MPPCRRRSPRFLIASIELTPVALGELGQSPSYTVDHGKRGQRDDKPHEQLGLTRQLAAEADDGVASQELKLRGICFDAAHHNLVLHLHLLHERSAPPARSVEKLRAAFAHAECHYGGQLGMVEVTLTPVDLRAKDYDPLDDSWYAPVRLALDWDDAERRRDATL